MGAGSEAMTGLRFERDEHQPLWTRVRSGCLIVGQISGVGGQGYRWSVGVVGYRTTSVHGRSATEAGARCGVRRAWRLFLQRAGLVHAP
jgi:hypothetical protein